MKLSNNFNLSEFQSKDKSSFPLDVIENLKQLAKNLQVIREKLGVKISINSGYRSPEHNRKINGAKNSFHVRGMAADLVASGHTPQSLFAAIEVLIDKGEISQGGLKAYRTFVHYDIRGIKSRW